MGTRCVSFSRCPVCCLSVVFGLSRDHIVEEEGAVCLVFRWFITSVLPVVIAVCLLFFFISCTADKVILDFTLG